ncbi:hypothetical protein KCU65_g863, partial [Aureobasidium melanogenum]
MSPIAGPSSKPSQLSNVTLHTAIFTSQDTLPQQTVEPTKAQTTDYGEPTTASCFALRRHILTKGFKKVFHSRHSKRKGVPSPERSVHLSDEEDQPVRLSVSENRGRKNTARLPLGARRPATLYDDGQGSWVGEFGYIYSGGLDVNRSRLSLALCSEVERAPRPSLEAKDGDQQVDSRTVRGLDDASNGTVEAPKDAGNSGDSGVEGDMSQDQQLSGDGSAHEDNGDQHMSNKTTGVEALEERCGPCDEHEDRCEDPECSCQNHDGCCSDAGDD